MNEPPYDEFESEIDDKRRVDLQSTLASLKLSSESFEVLREWLDSTSLERVMQNVLDSASKKVLHEVTTAERVKECNQLGRAASIMAKHFGALRSSGQTMRELSVTYRELFSEQRDEPVVSWSAFAKRVLSEALLLERVASETSKRLQPKKLRTGAPPKTDRNMLLAEWVDLLKRHTSIKRDDIYEPARQAWNAYFMEPKDEIRNLDQLKKAVAAGRAKRRK